MIILLNEKGKEKVKKTFSLKKKNFHGKQHSQCNLHKLFDW